MVRKRLLLWIVAAQMAAFGQTPEVKIAIVGMVHSHVWGHLGSMLKSDKVKLVGVSETVPELIEEGKRRGVPGDLFHSDYKSMLEKTKPDIVWAFVENNRHLEIAEFCAPRKIHLMYEKPLASTYADAVKIRDLSHKHGIQVLTNYQMAWWPSMYTQKKLADAGEFGKVWRLRGIVGHGGPGGPTGLNKWFFNWLTDPVQNGAGSLMDFGCYNALWSLWYMGKPETVYAQVNQLRPETFPKVEDNATMIFHYKNGVGLFEGSWDLPRSFQDLEIFGLGGSAYMTREGLRTRKGREPERAIPVEPLLPERADPISYMADIVKNKGTVDGVVAVDINVDVMEIIDALKESVKTGNAVKLKHSRN